MLLKKSNCFLVLLLFFLIIHVFFNNDFYNAPYYALTTLKRALKGYEGHTTLYNYFYVNPLKKWPRHTKLVYERSMVPRRGLEPLWDFSHSHLKAACLPISPPRHNYFNEFKYNDKKTIINLLFTTKNKFIWPFYYRRNEIPYFYWKRHHPINPSLFWLSFFCMRFFFLLLFLHRFLFFLFFILSKTISLSFKIYPFFFQRFYLIRYARNMFFCFRN